MEEQVGTFWHRWITHAANHRNTAAAVSLDQYSKQLGIIFRALGGDGGLKIEASYATNHFGHRSLLQRIAGSDKRVHSSWRDERALLLPPVIDLFPDQSLNRDLYLWLAMLASTPIDQTTTHWIEQNRQNTITTLKQFPGLQERYQRLAEAVVALRPPLKKLEPDQKRVEEVIREILLHPQSAQRFDKHLVEPATPIPLWLVPSPQPLSTTTELESTQQQETKESEGSNHQGSNKRYRAERTENPDGKSGLLALRMETIFSLAEYVKVDRTTDDEEDKDAESRAEDLDHLSITQDAQTSGSKLKFDLDLPAAEYDDTPLNDGILYPEWNYKTMEMADNHCRVIPLISSTAPPCKLPEKLRLSSKKVKRQFEALIPTRTWFRGEMDGAEVDLEAYIDFIAHSKEHPSNSEAALYRDFRNAHRDFATLLLADLSLSTDSWINNHARVVDVIRESLHLFSDALTHTGDQFALYGFSSLKREKVRFHQLKTFEEKFNDRVRGRIEMIKPGYYTRMGAAIRHATALLSRQLANHRILLLLTDGKPNDLDKYEGRYGIEDTRKAIFEAKQAGLHPFCVTIDEEGSSYLPHIFGPNGYIVIRKPEQLPLRLPRLYSQLTHAPI